MEPDKKSDIQLISDIQKDSKRSFEILFDRYYQRLCLFVEMITGSPDQSEEIVQQYFIDLWERRNATYIHTSVKSYLFRSVKNQALNWIRKERRITKVGLEENHLASDSFKETPEDSMIANQLFNQYDKAVSSLPTRTKTIYKMKFYQRMKQREIALALNVSESTVEKNVMKAIKHVRKVMSSYLGDNPWMIQ